MRHILLAGLGLALALLAGGAQAEIVQVVTRRPKGYCNKARSKTPRQRRGML